MRLRLRAADVHRGTLQQHDDDDNDSDDEETKTKEVGSAARSSLRTPARYQGGSGLEAMFDRVYRHRDGGL
jgi:hypothetical protein